MKETKVNARYLITGLFAVAGAVCCALGEANSCEGVQWDLMLQKRLLSLAGELSAKAKDIRNMQTAGQFRAYQESARANLNRILFDDEGAASGSKDLNEKLVGQPIVMDKYIIYRVVFESIPGCWVPANLYVPRNAKLPGPGIVAVADHSPGGKAAAYNQRMGIGFASKGYVTLVIDYPDRGEMVGGNDHFVNGVQTAATGLWSNYLFTVNAMRGVDYLESRTDLVDPACIGITGTSGGGMTSLVAGAVDKRIAVIAACCCIEPMEQCLRSGYTSCPEYMIPWGLAMGLEWSDIAAAAAPRPVMLVRAKRDGLFTQAGFDQMAGEAAAFYAVNNSRDRFRIVETNEPHTYSAAMRDAAYCWFAGWIGKNNDDVIGPWQGKVLEPEDVKYVLADGETVLQSDANLAVGVESKTSLHTIAMKRANRYAKSRYAFDAKTFGEREAGEIRGRVKKFYHPQTDLAGLKVRQVGSAVEGNTVIETLVMETAPGVLMPAKLLRGQNVKASSALLYLDEKGAQGLGGSGFEKLISSGTMILAVDLPGMGKLYPRASEWDKYEWCDISRILSYSSWTMGTSVPHLQIADAMAALDYLKQVDGNVPVYAAGMGRGAMVALMITAMSGEVKGVIGVNSLVSYRDYVEQELPSYNIMAISYGVLKEFDIPEVLAAVSERLILWAGVRDANNKAVSEKAMRQNYELARSMVKNPEKVFRTDCGSECVNYIQNLMQEEAQK